MQLVQRVRRIGVMSSWRSEVKREAERSGVVWHGGVKIAEYIWTREGCREVGTETTGGTEGPELFRAVVREGRWGSDEREMCFSRSSPPSPQGHPPRGSTTCMLTHASWSTSSGEMR